MSEMDAVIDHQADLQRAVDRLQIELACLMLGVCALGALVLMLTLRGRGVSGDA